jgi:hypothetical protein
MDSWAMVAICAIVGVGLFFFVRQNLRRDARAREASQKLWYQLDAAVLEVSQLVSKNCPKNELAHRFVVEASLHRHLFYVPQLSRLIVTYGMLNERYRVGFDLLAKARALATTGKTDVDSLESEDGSALYEEVVQKYMLVSKKCPGNTKAHQMLIEAIEHTNLPYTPALARVIVTQSMFEARFQRCREILAQVEAIANAAP